MDNSLTTPKYQRVLLKLSGEALMGDAAFGISTKVLDYLAAEIQTLVDLKVQTSLVIGAGNIFRGIAGASTGMNRTGADNMGMLATVINALALHDALERNGIAARVLSAIPMLTVCEPYSQQKAVHHLRKGRVVIFGAGTANPYFTTDTAAVLRGLEINADLLAADSPLHVAGDIHVENHDGGVIVHGQRDCRRVHYFEPPPQNFTEAELGKPPAVF